jgi:hypothetical protein
VREIAWNEGFVVAAIDLRRDAPLHKGEVIYHRIMDGMRTDHIRDAPALEFIVQEWLFNLEREIQRATGLHPSHPEHRSEISRMIEQQITEQLLKLHIYDSSLVNALHTYYTASQQHKEPVATVVAGWLKGEPNVSAELLKECHITGAIGKDNAFDFLQVMTKLVVHIGYAGLIVLCDDAELLCSISRPDSRNAAYENIRFLMEGTAEGEFAHCGFIFAGTDELFRHDLRGMASYPALHARLKPGRIKRRTSDEQQPLILLEGFDQRKLHDVALKVKDVHAIAYHWDPNERLTDELVTQLIEDAATQFGEKLKTMPRGFLKVLVDILDELYQSPHRPLTELISGVIDPDRIEEIEREEAHLLDST